MLKTLFATLSIVFIAAGIFGLIGFFGQSGYPAVPLTLIVVGMVGLAISAHNEE